MKNKKIYVLPVVLLSIFFSIFPTKKALVCVPIADLVGQPMSNLYKSKSPSQMYRQMPLESKRATFGCPRLHQLLFNEMVEIVYEGDQEIKVKIPHFFYVTYANPQQKNCTFWAQKKDFISFDQLKNYNLDSKFIPKPIQFEAFHISHDNTITLKHPFYDKKTRQTFSAGTRFIVCKKSNKHFKITIFDPKKSKFIKISIPKKLCFENGNNRAKLVKLAKEWAHLPNGFIPYVWGGCSFAKPCTTKKVIKSYIGNTPIFIRENYNQYPATGFDCVGLIARAAQICNIPFFFKNTTTVEKFLKSVTNYNNIEEGDIVWYRGHVMIVSDLKNNKIIEARTNEYGCGKVQEISLNKAFKSIETFEQLFRQKDKGIKRLNMHGKVVANIKNLKIFKLPID